MGITPVYFQIVAFFLWPQMKMGERELLVNARLFTTISPLTIFTLKVLVETVLNQSNESHGTWYVFFQDAIAQFFKPYLHTHFHSPSSAVRLFGLNKQQTDMPMDVPVTGGTNDRIENDDHANCNYNSL